MARLLARQPATLEEPPTADKPYLAWTKDEVRPIQKELRRMRLYDLGIDGILGKISDQGLVEAFGGDEWRTMDSAGVLERLKAAERPKPKGAKGGDFRYGELFKDGLLDLTFGYGFMEELNADEWVAYAKEMEDALVARGYVEDAKKAAELYAAAGRKTSAFGRFFVKPDALKYDPPAGRSAPDPLDRALHHEPGRRQGRRGQGGVRAGHGAGRRHLLLGPRALRDRPRLRPQLRQDRAARRGRQRRAGARELQGARQVLSDESGGNPWTRFLWREKRGRIRIDLKNAGNLRMNAKSPHMDEFGGKLIQWALDQNGGVDVVTGKEGSLAGATAANPDRKYRVMVFDGCNTRDYERAIRKTPGFDTRGADIIGTTRSVGFGAEVEAFTAFLDGLVGEQSPAEIIKGMNEEMKQHESDYSGAPFKGGGFEDNPSQ